MDVTPEWVVDGLVAKVRLGLDAEALRMAASELIARHPLIHDSTKQLSLQIRKGSDDPWYESCFRDADIAPETEYDMLNPELEDTYFKEVFAAFPFPVFRARLMALTSRHCYSVHHDETPRFHVAIETSKHAPFVFVDRNEVFRVPADGDGYWLDTRQEHTAMNGASDLRIHLVVGLDQWA
ncbi:hypothetical protein [Streptomyces cyaneofuscatus]|uniref:hypothetical protein n=1 Tax=Streptomyces cyaneofuscatus TaxID=66883 RepID=UPI0033B8F4CF